MKKIIAFFMCLCVAMALTSCEKIINKAGREIVKELPEKWSKKIFKQESKEISEKNIRKVAQKVAANEGKEIVQKLEGKAALKYLAQHNPEIERIVTKLTRKGGPLGDTPGDFIVEITKDGATIVRHSNPLAESSAIAIKGNTIRAASGCTKKCGAPNFLLDHGIPNKTYIIDEGKYVFSTDAKGRTGSVIAKYTESVKEIKYPLDDARREVGVLQKGGKTSIHDAGHIVQRNQGGINEGINLLPMKSSWQRPGGAWRQFEEEEEALIERAMAEGKEVISKRKIIYKGDTAIPDKIEVSVFVDGIEQIGKVLVCP